MTSRDSDTRDSGEVRDFDLRPEEEAAARAVRELPHPEARSVFRERLRQEFVEGRVHSTRLRSPAVPWRIAWGLVIPAAAAALLFVSLNRGPYWRLLDPPAGGSLIVDGRAVPMDQADRVLKGIKPGTRIALQDTSVVILSSPGNLAMQILPGTNMTVPAPPGRWFARRVRSTVETGEVRITTDRLFHGAELFVSTPELGVEVTGTTVAVLRLPFGTCVCVLEGTVRVMPPSGGPPEPVGPGGRFTYHRDEKSVDRGEMLPDERVKLGMLKSMCVGERSGSGAGGVGDGGSGGGR